MISAPPRRANTRTPRSGWHPVGAAGNLGAFGEIDRVPGLYDPVRGNWGDWHELHRRWPCS
jgi:hypothetical protein